MKPLVIVLSMLFSLSCFAKTKAFEIKVNEISVNDSLDMQPRTFKVKPGETVVVSRSFDAAGKNTIVEMTVADDDTKIKDGILMKLTIIEEVAGSKKIIGTPQMIVRSGLEATMTEGKEGEAPFIKASLIGKRIQ